MIHPTAQIHPSAVVDEAAVIGANVRIGPFCLVERDVEIGAGTELLSHVVVKGPTVIGEDNRIFQFATLGEACQDLKYKGEPTRLQIGSRNTIRENVTMHRGTVQDAGLTQVGDDNLFQIATHIAHDCIVGNHCIFSNGATLAGHVTVKDHAVVGGLTGVHQFCIIGEHSMVGAASMVVKDIPPYVIAQGNHAAPFGVNTVGLKRRGFTSETIRAIREAYKIIYKRGHTLAEARDLIEAQLTAFPELQLFIDLFDTTERGIVR